MMKSLFIFTATILLTLTAFGQNQIDSQGRKQGPWSKTYPKSIAVRYSGQFKDDKPVGTFVYNDANNQLSSKVTHRGNGVSYCINYYVGARKKSSEGKYVNQKKDSIWTFYNNMGAVLTREWYENDKRNGPSETYFDNGKPAVIQHYVNDKLEGEIREYFPNDQLRRECTAVNGKITGMVKTYFEDGTLQSEGLFVEGKKEKDWKFYGEDGELEAITQFTNDRSDTTIKISGEFKTFYEPGKIKSVHHYKNKLMHGEFTEWHDSGVWTEEKVTDDRLEQTNLKRTLQGHHISRKGQYSFGKLNGKIQYFDEHGNHTKTENYNLGTLIE